MDLLLLALIRQLGIEYITRLPIRRITLGITTQLVSFTGITSIVPLLEAIGPLRRNPQSLGLLPFR